MVVGTEVVVVEVGTEVVVVGTEVVVVVGTEVVVTGTEVVVIGTDVVTGTDDVVTGTNVVATGSDVALAAGLATTAGATGLELPRPYLPTKPKQTRLINAPASKRRSRVKWRQIEPCALILI